MKLSHFKGIKDFNGNFGQITNIYGANASGKTTLKDAFRWVLFGKDSTGRADFEIKTIDPKTGRAIPNVEHEVNTMLNINNSITDLKKTYAEKWVTRRGSSIPEFKGHETEHFVDGVPLRKTDYDKQIEFICEEETFKIITDPHYFSEQMHWLDRRKVLLEVAGEIHDYDIAGDDPKFKELIAEMAKYDDPEDFKKMLYASVKKQKEQLALIPARIDEVSRSKPEPINVKAVENALAEKQTELKEVEEKIEDVSKANQADLQKKADWQTESFEAKSKVVERENELRAQAKEQGGSLELELSNLKQQKSEWDSQAAQKSAKSTTAQREIESLTRNIDSTNSRMVDLRVKWSEINAETLKEGDEDCPTCHQHLPENMLAKVQDDFAKNKQSRMEQVRGEGKELSAKVAQWEKDIEGLDSAIETLTNENQEAIDKSLKLDAKIKDVEDKISKMKSFEEVFTGFLAHDKDYITLTEALVTIEKAEPKITTADNSELKAERTEIQAEIDKLKIELSAVSQIEKADERVKELKESEQKLTEEIVAVDEKLFILAEFLKKKNEAVEESVNDKFTLVNFRLFREQINGGYQDVCDVMVDGVPYPDLNNAMKINAGIDIINTLTTHYDVCAPIFIDNAESITNILESESQQIRLYVSEADEKLRIENI